MRGKRNNTTIPASAYGMIMPNRSFSSPDYRYGSANGQEKVDEISGNGNHYTAPYWEYDPRAVHRWNMDPVVKENESPYVCYANNPIWFTDPDGADTTIMIDVTVISSIEKREGDPEWVPTGTKLKSTMSVALLVRNGEVVGGAEGVVFETDVTEFESPVLWGLDPAFTEISFKELVMEGDKIVGGYVAQTQLSNFEVMGQWLYTAKEGIWQDNIITVTQMVVFSYDPETNDVKVLCDGSSFPEHNFEIQTHSFEKKVGASDETGKLEKKEHSVTLTQSSYEKAVKDKTFHEFNHTEKKTVTSDF